MDSCFLSFFLISQPFPPVLLDSSACCSVNLFPPFSHLPPLLSPTVKGVGPPSRRWFRVSPFSSSTYPFSVLKLIQLLLHLHHHQLHVVKAGTGHQLHPMLQVFHRLSAEAVGPTHSFSISMELDFKCVDLSFFFCQFNCAAL